MEISKEQIAALKSQHPGVKLVQLTNPTVGVSVIVRKPNSFDYGKWADRKSDPDSRSKASRLLFQECVLHPNGEDLHALLEEYPALPDTFAGDLLELAGAAAKTEKKEL